jgi:N4-gp56 family major capsid protein
MASTGIFWQSVATPQQSSFTSDVFFDTGDAAPITRAEMSKELMKKVMPEATFRKFASKFTNFGSNQGKYLIVPKKMTRGYDTLWKGDIGEFDPLPDQTMSYKTSDIAVDERGFKIPFTLQAQIFSNFDIVAEVREQLSQGVVASLERDLIENAIGYLDVLGLNTSDNGLTVQTGVSVFPDKTFSQNTTPITIKQQDVSSTKFAPLTLDTILNFAKALTDLNTPSYDGKGFGNYLVIINHQAQNDLMRDPDYKTMVSRLQDKDRIYNGYVGMFYGQDIILDRGKWIDLFFGDAQAAVKGKAIAIFLSKDAIREAVIRPEQVLPTEKADFGRFMSIAVNTIRGEVPTWFASEGQPAGGILIGA